MAAQALPIPEICTTSSKLSPGATVRNCHVGWLASFGPDAKRMRGEEARQVTVRNVFAAKEMPRSLKRNTRKYTSSGTGAYGLKSKMPTEASALVAAPLDSDDTSVDARCNGV